MSNEQKTIVMPAPGSEKKEPCSSTFEGKIVSLTGDKLVMRNKEGKVYSHTVAKDAKLTRDGATCKAVDLKAGAKIRVTTKQNDKSVATGIESLSKQTEFAQCV